MERPISIHTESGDDEPDEFPSADLEAIHYKGRYAELLRTLQETKAELDDFQTSSKELEEELERELAATEAAQHELRQRASKLEADKEEWKGKYLAAQKSHNLALGSLQRELDTIASERDRLKVSLRDLEMGVDDLERNERMVSSSLQDVEARYNRAIEEKTILEQELIGKQQVEEELQRTKDEMRDLQTEVSVLKHQRIRSLSHSHAPEISMAAPGASLSPVKESGSSQELTLSDLETSFAIPMTPSAAATSNVPRSTSSPNISRIDSPSKTRLPQSPSGIPRSSTTRVLSSGSGSSAPAAHSSPGSSRVGVRSTAVNGRAPLASFSVSDTRSKGVRMVSDLGERVRTLQSRIQNSQPKARRATTATAAASDPSSAATSIPHPRMKALGVAMNAPLPPSPGTPGGGGDWVLVSEDEGSPTPATPAPILEGLGRSNAHPILTAQRQLPTRPGIPSPLGVTFSTKRSAEARPARPLSRNGMLSKSAQAGASSTSSTSSTRMPLRPTTPTRLPAPPSSSGIPRPSSPAHNYSSSESEASSRSFHQRPHSTSAAMSSSSIRRSIRRASLIETTGESPPSSRGPLPSRLPAPRTSIGGRPLSAPVPPKRSAVPPVPSIPPAHLRKSSASGSSAKAEREDRTYERPTSALGRPSSSLGRPSSSLGRAAAGMVERPTSALGRAAANTFGRKRSGTTGAGSAERSR